jgi:hypothetical protein
MAKVKAGFCVQLINRELVADALLPDALDDWQNRTTLDFFCAAQEDANQKLDASKHFCSYTPLFCQLIVSLTVLSKSVSKIEARPFLKLEGGNPFYGAPVSNPPLFPQFEGIKPLGVTRDTIRNQAGNAHFLLSPLDPF